MTINALSKRDLLARGGAALALAAVAPAGALGAAPLRPVTPFRIDIPQAKLDRIMARVRDVEWPDAPAGDPWKYGTSLPVMKDLVAHWTTRYDWRQRETEMNRLPQFMARVEDHDIHFIHIKGSGRHPQPMLMMHGWPGSFVEFHKVIDPLAHPEKYGGKVEDAFSLVVPSLPGFGFSSKPTKPVGEVTMARLFDQVMANHLGYTRYIAQGGDMGALVALSNGYYHANHCKAVHLNFLTELGPRDQLGPFTPEELVHLSHMGRVSKAPGRPGRVWPNREGAYAIVQLTKPMTLSYAMMDSPVGAAAWIFERFRISAQLPDGNPWSVFSRDEILDNIMVYLVTGTFGTATWAYAAPHGEEGEELVPPRMSIGRVPLGIANFPGESLMPRSWVERNYNLIHWNDLPEGGHFAALEKPQLFIEDVRAFGRKVRALQA